MKKTLVAYTVIIALLAILLYFLSMSWMNFLFKPNLKKEIEIIVSQLPKQHPLVTEKQINSFTKDVENVIDEIGLFVSYFEYYEKLAPAFTKFEDTFTYLDFWEGALHSASVFPLLFKYRAGKLLIDDSIGNIIPRGAQIVAINKQPIDEIMDYYRQFVYANTQEEKAFWAVERYLLNFYPEFFSTQEYLLQYVYEGNQFEKKVKRVPWNEFTSWKRRIESKWYELKEYESLMVLKVFDLSYSEQNTYEIRNLMKKIISLNPSKLLIDLTDTKGKGENYYNLQIFLSYLTEKVGYLIPSQITTYNQQKDAFAVIPQDQVFSGKVYFLLSKYSVYPYIKALISFCRMSKTGEFIGEAPLSTDNYFSNPYQQPLYISYLLPKVCRTYNEFEIEAIESAISEEFIFGFDDYCALLTFEKDYRDYFSKP